MTDKKDEWIKHDGGECPVDPEQYVKLKSKIGIMTAMADMVKWSNVTEYQLSDEPA